MALVSWCVLPLASTDGFQKMKTRWDMVNAKNKLQERPCLLGGGLRGWYLLKKMTFRMNFEGRVEMSEGRDSG